MFKISLLESLKNISKNKFLTSLMVFLFALIFLLQGYTMSYYAAKNLITGHFDHESLINYNIYELGCHGVEPLQLFKMYKGTIDIDLETAEYFAELEASDYITYVGLDERMAAILDFKGDPKTFAYNYDVWEPNHFVKILEVTPNFHDVEKYTVIEGRDFTDEDMLFVEGKPRPVLLGYKYRELYDVGDILVRTELGEAEVVPQLEVIGFLAEDTTVMERAGHEIYDLDSFIVYPRYIIPIDEWANYDREIIKNAVNTNELYAFYEVKMMFSEESEEQGLIDWRNAIDNYGCFGQYFTIMDTEYSMEKLTSRFEIVTSFFAEITAVMIFFSTITILISIRNRVANNVKDYAIHIAVGATRGSTIGFIIAEMSIILTCSVILGIIATKWLMYYMNMPFYFWQFLGVYVLTSVIILALSAIVARLAIRKYDICTLIK